MLRRLIVFFLFFMSYPTFALMIEDMNDFSLICSPPPESRDPIFHLHFIKDSSYPTSHRVTVKQPTATDCRPALMRKDDKKVYADDWTRLSIFLRCDSDDFFALDIDRLHGLLYVSIDGFPKSNAFSCEIKEFTNEEILRETRF